MIQTKYITEVLVDEFTMLSPKKSGATTSEGYGSSPSQGSAEGNPAVEKGGSDDLPF